MKSLFPQASSIKSYVKESSNLHCELRFQYLSHDALQVQPDAVYVASVQTKSTAAARLNINNEMVEAIRNYSGNSRNGHLKMQA